MSASLKKSATRKSLPEISDDDLQSALSWQQIQLLFWDIDNLEELYKGAVAKYNLGSEKATRLLTRANVSLQRLDEWASQVLLNNSELNQFAVYRKILETLAFNLADYLRVNLKKLTNFVGFEQ